MNQKKLPEEEKIGNQQTPNLQTNSHFWPHNHNKNPEGYHQPSELRVNNNSVYFLSDRGTIYNTIIHLK